MKRMAMLQNGVVENIAEWDGVAVWHPGLQYTLVDITSQPQVDIGWTYDGHQFSAPINE